MENQEFELDLRNLFEIIKKRFWIIAVIMVITTSVSAIVSYFFLDKVYESSAKLVVTKKAEGSELQYNDLMLNQRLVKTYSEIAKSRSIADEVINNLGLNISPGAFSSKVQVSSLRDTEVIQIKVEDNNPQLAADIANELSRVFMKRVVNLIKIDNIQILDQAIPPTSPIKPRANFNIAIAFVLGAMLGLGVVFLLEYLDNTIKGPEDIEKYLKLPVIATIPYVEEDK